MKPDLYSGLIIRQMQLTNEEIKYALKLIKVFNKSSMDDPVTRYAITAKLQEVFSRWGESMGRLAKTYQDQAIDELVEKDLTK